MSSFTKFAIYLILMLPFSVLQNIGVELIDFFKGRDALQRFFNRVLNVGAEALLAQDFFDFRSRAVFLNGVTEFRCCHQELIDGDTAFIASTSAVCAAAAPLQFYNAIAKVVAFTPRMVLWELILLSTLCTDTANESLCHNSSQNVANGVRLQAKVGKTRNRTNGVVGVQRSDTHR